MRSSTSARIWARDPRSVPACAGPSGREQRERHLIHACRSHEIADQRQGHLVHPLEVVDRHDRWRSLLKAAVGCFEQAERIQWTRVAVIAADEHGHPCAVGTDLAKAAHEVASRRERYRLLRLVADDGQPRIRGSVLKRGVQQSCLPGSRGAGDQRSRGTGHAGRPVDGPPQHGQLAQSANDRCSHALTLPRARKKSFPVGRSWTAHPGRTQHRPEVAGVVLPRQDELRAHDQQCESDG